MPSLKSKLGLREKAGSKAEPKHDAPRKPIAFAPADNSFTLVAWFDGTPHVLTSILNDPIGFRCIDGRGRIYTIDATCIPPKPVA